MRTKEEDTIELAMRLVVALRSQSMLHSNGMTRWLAGHYDDENTRDIDRKIARDVTAMARNFVEEIHAAVIGAPPAPALQGAMQKVAPSGGFVSEPLDWQTEMDATIRAREARKPDIEAP